MYREAAIISKYFLSIRELRLLLLIFPATYLGCWQYGSWLLLPYALVNLKIGYGKWGTLIHGLLWMGRAMQVYWKPEVDPLRWIVILVSARRRTPRLVCSYAHPPHFNLVQREILCCPCATCVFYTAFLARGKRIIHNRGHGFTSVSAT